MEYVQYKNGKPHYYRDNGPEIEECLQYQVRTFYYYFFFTTLKSRCFELNLILIVM